jgi:hypothetical protein
LGPEERVGRGVDVPDVEADAGAEDEGVAEGRLEGIVRYFGSFGPLGRRVPGA